MSIRIERAQASDLDAVLGVLAEAELPPEGVREHFGEFRLARGDGGELLGCVGMERYGGLGLLRSLAVRPEARGRSIGVQLVEALLREAAAAGVEEMVLLTTTARAFFEGKFAFRAAARAEYDARLAHSPEWTLPRCSSAALLTLTLAKPTRVLILCTGNSARSQMAEGILRHDGGAAFEVESAGVRPGQVRPEAIAAMREIGIDISGHRSKSVEEFRGQEFDYVITVCDNANETCPVFPSRTRRIHQRFEDPPPPGVGNDEERLAIFRRVRDEIRAWMRSFSSGGKGEGKTE